jgi:predicted ATP-dependent serine protease
MARRELTFICQNCGATYGRRQGKCGAAHAPGPPLPSSLQGRVSVARCSKLRMERLRSPSALPTLRGVHHRVARWLDADVHPGTRLMASGPEYPARAHREAR